MSHRWSRRSFVSITSGLSALGVSGLAARAWAQPAPINSPISAGEVFPAQDPAAVKEAVTTSHGNLARIRELVERQPALARASIDWGFGDWETCIDAGAHVGNRPNADLLLNNDMRPSILSAAQIGQPDAVTSF